MHITLRFCLAIAGVALCLGAGAALPSGDIHIRDPFVIADGEEGVYRLYSSIYARKNEAADAWRHTGQGVEMYLSRDLEQWTGPRHVLELPKELNCTAVWAPEVHEFNGRWYLFATLTFNGTKVPHHPGWRDHVKRGTWIFAADRPEGPYEIVKRDSVTPPNWSALDGTLVVEDGRPYMVFCHEWTQVRDGEMCLMPLRDDLSDAAGDPVTLFKASSAPDVKASCLVTDGPSLFRDAASGDLLMTWSTVRSNGAYCVYWTKSETGSVKGPWKNHRMLFPENGGHGMSFRKLVGGGDRGPLTLTLHQPNGPAGAERMRFFEIEYRDGVLRTVAAAEPDLQASVPKLDLTDPLTSARAYSLEIDEHMNGTDGFFPVGVLGENFTHGFNVAVGGNYVCRGVDKNTKPEDFAPQGVYGISIWGAISAQTRPWLAKIRDQDGKEVRCACLFDPKVREYIFDFARTSVSNALAVADDRIFKWEIDNEYLPPLDYSDQAVAAFRVWLETKSYKGDLAKLNRAWGKDYNSFAEAEPCRLDDYAKTPGHFMDWIRFQQESFAEFLAEYYKIIQSCDPKRRSVNGKDTQSSLEMQRIARTRRGNHELIGKAIAPYTDGVRGMDHYGHGDRNAYEMNCYTHTIVPDDWRPGKRRGMLYGENNNHNGPGWQFAQTVWRMIPNGLKGGTFFCNGWFGAWGDWASFGFINPDATNREKIYYLPRFYSAVHRTERLFTESAPVRGTPTLAILMAVRDVPFGIDDNMEPWGFPINSRLRLYKHLRDAGYHVNVITYEKINPVYMSQIDGLFLCAAEHFDDAEIERIRAYVKGGGRLFCDVRCGAFDEHNLPRTDNNLTDVLGVTFEGIWESHDIVVDQGDVWFGSPWGNLVRADGKVRWKLTTAEVVNAQHGLYYSNKAAIWTRNRYGKGRAYWTNTQMGTIRSESANDEVPAREMFRALLKDAGIVPSYTLSTDETCNFRCEKPLVDTKGNVVIAVSALTYRPAAPATLDVRLPADLVRDVRKAYIGLAEGNALDDVPFTRTADGVRFELPALKSAAFLYLLRDHAPLLGTAFADFGGRAAAPDEATPLLKPGATFRVNVTVDNPSVRADFAGGRVQLHALKGWKVSPAQTCDPLKRGARAAFAFTLTVPAEDNPELYPNRIYPLTVDLFDREGRRVAVTHTVVCVDVPKKGREVLLSDNWVSRNMPWSEWTGATYRHLSVADETKGEEIKDALNATRANGTEIWALQSGDRAGRRRSCVWKGIAEPTVEFDLKSVRDLTRIMFWEMRTQNRALGPVAVKVAFSENGRDYTEAKSFVMAWSQKLHDVSRYAEIRLQGVRGRYVRLAFTPNRDPKHNKNGDVALDEVYIFGLGR